MPGDLLAQFCCFVSLLLIPMFDLGRFLWWIAFSVVRVFIFALLVATLTSLLFYHCGFQAFDGAFLVLSAYTWLSLPLCYLALSGHLPLNVWSYY